jgi:hypothetical protein
MLGSSWVAAQLAASQEGLSSVSKYGSLSLHLTILQSQIDYGFFRPIISTIDNPSIIYPILKYSLASCLNNQPIWFWNTQKVTTVETNLPVCSCCSHSASEIVLHVAYWQLGRIQRPPSQIPSQAGWPWPGTQPCRARYRPHSEQRLTAT